MTAASRARFAEVVRSEPLDLGLACLLVGVEVDPDLDLDLPLALLDALAASARPLVPLGAPPELAAEGLRVALGERGGFAGAAEDYADLRSSLLHEVLVRTRGLPLLLTVVWLEVAARLDVPAYALALPGHVVAGIGDPDDVHVHVDPFRGGRPLSDADLDDIVRGAIGRPLAPEDLRPTAARGAAAAAADQRPGAVDPPGPAAGERPHPAVGHRAVAAPAAPPAGPAARARRAAGPARRPPGRGGRARGVRRPARRRRPGRGGAGPPRGLAGPEPAELRRAEGAPRCAGPPPGERCC